MPRRLDKFLQIAPHSLAIVLSPCGGDEAAPPEQATRAQREGDAGGEAGRGSRAEGEPAADSELGRHHIGYEIFADFKQGNMQHFWNQKVTAAVAETFFLGWIDEQVLLIQGKEEHLEALREGWMRRALKPPAGFQIKCLGDVSPISMSPISQSQFIPLGEILCLAISSMNSARKQVTQEALIEHLTTCFPGVPTPSPEILRHTLNMLVRERKIYPTPDGYFIVTPQTYFITPSLIRTNSKWYHLDERIPDRSQCTSPQQGTITPSTSGCVRDRTLPKNHCDSCHCCREDMHSMHASTLQRKSTKDCKDSYCPPSLCQVPPTEKSKSTVNFSYKTETLSKPKDGEKQSKKFGLKLFRLSFKKDKTKQLANFSAQFPPEEWPLRDEDTPTTIPREVEMEIIRRINPDLTVENVMRHTALMKKLEEEKAQRSKAGSSAHHSGRSKKSRSHRKSHGKSRSHSKTRISKGDPSEGSHLEVPGEREYDFYDPLMRSPREGCYIIEHKRENFIMHSSPNVLESHFPMTPEWDVSGELAKRRTEMPFPEPSRGSSHSKVHRSHSHTQDRRSRNERSNKAKERSRSMDNSKGPLGTASLGTPEDIIEACSQDDQATSQTYIDDSTLRPSQSLSHQRALLSSVNYKEVIKPEKTVGSAETPTSCTLLEQSKPTENLPPYNELSSCTTKSAIDDYFQCNTSSETVLTAPSPLGKNKDDSDPVTLADSTKKVSPSERQSQHLAREPGVHREESPKGPSNSSGPIATSQTAEVITNGRLAQHHSTESSSLDKRKEIFSKDTLFKPLHSTLSVNSFHKPNVPHLKPHQKTPSETLPSRCDKLEQAMVTSVTQVIPIPQRQQETAGNQEAAFDYYNVSDDDDSEEGTNKNTEEEKNRDDVGTMQWLLEREKERDLQRKFEKNLTLLAPKETENSNSQRATHSARLDSMDSSSITVDSGFNSPRTRESLASNTSSIVESNRRQNPALSPAHGGVGPVFSFRATADPPTSETEKLQKPANCLQASVTSV
ncbi:storkhead-box protein 2 isoform X1 [Thamnophis elegans]|uniref:storkhead-box protein 2 isoform X1 n=1 Tax=Thamnophis elegans TaxID=35005 RepID=UPI0013789025|nr:storkhead-box protein 2 isoform X1 [Thamnophis elegans]